MASVANPDSLISSYNQYIRYNAFNKADSIAETVNGNACVLKILYGPDQQRWKSELKKGNILEKTIIFAGDYERIIEGNVTKQLYYISGGSGLAAVYVKQSGASDAIYYVHSDHLGSVLSLTDANGSVKFKATYDAWGKQSISTNTFKFHRGYTGHEHLTEFKLINMNGRIYDPLLGRFFSPDPYVQMPEYSQNFNRYSYCLNNPLKYTDPSGELFWLIPNISWSKSGGISIGVSAIVGIPGVISAQAGIGYSMKSNDAYAYIGATAAFNTVYVSASTSSGIGVGWSTGLSPQMGFPISTNFTSVGVNYNITHDSWSANLSAWSVDKSGWTFNPSVTAMFLEEQATNWVKGQGFRSNDEVLSRFVNNGEQQKALKYFGFKGTYDPNAGNSYFDPSDASIHINNNAFSKNYDYLRGIYEEELFHSKDYLYAKNNTPEGLSSHEYEEWRAQNYLYKNQGLYSQSGINWAQRINNWGVQAEVYDMYTSLFTPKWWHFVYKIQRRW
jgi:RHS repeat-associated protein